VARVGPQRHRKQNANMFIQMFSVIYFKLLKLRLSRFKRFEKNLPLNSVKIFTFHLNFNKNISVEILAAHRGYLFINALFE